MSSRKLLWLLPLLLTACGRGDNRSAYERSHLGSNTADTTAVTEELLPLTSPERKIIRTADLSCKVQNVYTATTKLEQMVKATGGIVQESHLNNGASATKTTWYTRDSLRELNTYTSTVTLTLRVPVQYLDSVINAIPGMVSFIDNRTIKQNDVTYQYLSNELKNLGDGDKLKAAKNSKEQLATRQYEDNKTEQQINREIANLQMMDDISYATLTIALSQPEQVYTQTILNVDHANRTPLLLQCKAALYNGWELIMSSIIMLMNIWPLLLLIVLWLVYRKRWNRLLPVVKK